MLVVKGTVFREQEVTTSIPIESPFEWVAPSRFGVVRRYGRGPLREMTVQVELEALATARTLLTYRAQVWPRGIIGAASARLQIGFLGRRSFGRVFELYAKGASQSHTEVGDDQGLPSTPSVGASSTLSPEAASRLRALITRLGELGHGRGLRERLARLLEEGHDLDLTRGEVRIHEALIAGHDLAFKRDHALRTQALNRAESG